jgi:tetratricopeptide (TPR) repeat protein
MTIERNEVGCLDAETIAAFAEGKLKRGEISEVLEHLDRCPTCMSAIGTANEVMSGQPRSLRRWLAAAAVIGAIVIAVPIVQRTREPIHRLVQLVPREERNVEPRLSGGFAWAPYRGPMRATNQAADVQRMKLMGAAAELIEHADADPGSRHAAGLALVLIDHSDDAIATLKSGAEKSPADAKSWSDLAAAEYSAALRFGRPSLYPEALAHADHALQIDPHLGESLFNRALILERLGLTQQAREAWQRYLAADASSPWANEAREHLARLPAKSGATLFKEEEPRLLASAARGDQKTVDAIVDRYRQQARTFAEGEYLGRWGEAQDPSTLAAARAIGDALLRLNGEGLLHDAVAAIDQAPPSQRTTIAQAHAIYRRARIAYSHHLPAAAEPDLRRAAELFASAGDPMALVARYYAANTRFDQNDRHAAGMQLEELLREADAHPRYAALGANVRWEIALGAVLEGDWSRVVDAASPAAAAFQRLGEPGNAASVEPMIADALLYLGRPEDAWAQWIKLFDLQSSTGMNERIATVLCEASLAEQTTGHADAGRALLRLAESAARQSNDEMLLSNILFRGAMLDAYGSDYESAARNASESMRVATGIRDPGLRARAVADANVGAGAAALATDWRLARQVLTHAIDYYAASGKSVLLPEALLLRARASAREGDHADALRDLEAGMAEIEKHKSLLEGNVVGTGVYDAGRALYEDAIRLSLDRRATAAAFEYAERARGVLAPSADWRPVALATLQQRLRGSGAAILDVVLLPNELVTFAITAERFEVVRRGRSSDLYEALIRPVEQMLAGARQLIVVADRPLQGVSFAGLYDSEKHRYLIEQMPVSMAESASALAIADSPPVARKVVAMALPTAGAPATLAESATEVAEVEAFYPRSLHPREATLEAFTREAAGADVVHISGHTERQAGGGDDALMFAGERVSWRRAASMSIGHPIVVLAACETLRVPDSPRSHALSIGGGFLAAGASAVIGTLVPIADNEAREIFRTIHRGLASGESPASAVRYAQLEALGKRSGAWRAVTLLVNQIRRTAS